MTLSSTSSRGTAQVFPTSVWIDPYVTPKNQGGWTARPTSALFLNGFAAQSSFTAPPPGDYIEWDMLMASGTWALSVIGEKNTSSSSYGGYLQAIGLRRTGA